MLQPADLLDPAGDLEAPVLWPRVSSSKITTRLQGYLTRAYAHPLVAELDEDARDAPARQWAYYLAYGAVYRQMVRRPSTVEVTNRGLTATLITQIQLMKDLRDEALAAFEAALVEEVEETEVVRAPLGSRSVAVQLVF